MAEETKTTEEQPQENKEQFIKCPCCGELTLRKPLDIKSGVLDEYMASIIAGVPFQHTYTLYGNIDITVTVPTKAERRKLYSTLQLLDRIIKAIPAERELDKAVARELSGTLQAYSPITSVVTRSSNKVQKQFEPADALYKVCDAIIERQKELICLDFTGDNTDAAESVLQALKELHDSVCSETVLSAIPDVIIRAVTKTHVDLYNILMDTGFDANFWKGIELI